MSVPVDATKYPQHARLQSLNGSNQVVGEFLEWLEEKGIRLCEIPEGMTSTYYPVMTGRDTLLADFFEIDRRALEAEKQAMLAEFTRAIEQAKQS